MKDNQPTGFWGIIEMMGHGKIAGWCTEESVADVKMIRVDVPQSSNHDSYSRFISTQAIFAVNPMSEESCRLWIEESQARPWYQYEISLAVKRKAHAIARDALDRQFALDHD